MFKTVLVLTNYFRTYHTSRIKYIKMHKYISPYDGGQRQCLKLVL